jgi:hypothetical protein
MKCLMQQKASVLVNISNGREPSRKSLLFLIVFMMRSIVIAFWF